MKKSIFTFVLILTLISLTLVANAQGQIMLQLKLPPEGKLNVADFWQVTLTNNSDSVKTVYLVGTATEEKDGLIVKGTTVPFSLKRGTTILAIKDLPRTPEVEYISKDPKYKNALIRTGSFPSGAYEICVSVKNANNNEEEGNDCYSHEVHDEGMLTLINPSDGEELDPKTPVIFTWSYSGKMPGDGYKLRIVEVNKGQSPEDAMERNRVFFEKDRINSTTFPYPISAPKFDEGKKYAWNVKFLETNSEVFTFFFKESIDTIKILPEDEGLIKINLLSPMEGDSLMDSRPDFKWLPERSLPGAKYKLKVVEMRKDQDPEDAINSNPAFIDEQNISETSLNYPSGVTSLDTGKIYAWQVNAVDSKQKLIGRSSYAIINLPHLSPLSVCNLHIDWPDEDPYQLCQGLNLTISFRFLTNGSGSTHYELISNSTDPATNITGNSSNTSINIDLGNMSDCGKFIYTLTATRGGCSRTKSFTVLVYPQISNFQITDMSLNPITPLTAPEICNGDEGKLVMSNFCDGFIVSWEFRDRPQNGSWTTWTSWGSGNPRNTNSINPTCASGVSFIEREYRATLSQPSDWPTSWPGDCPVNNISRTIKVWCKPQAGNISANPNNLCAPPYTPIALDIGGPIVATSFLWSSTGGTLSNTAIQNPEITFSAAGTYTVSVQITNGTCPVITKTRQIIVENPLSATIEEVTQKHDVCPCEYATLKITNLLPPNVIIQWQFLVNCSGNWENAGTGPEQNTNAICPSNPFYTGLIDKLCWRVKVSTENSICDPAISNEWEFNIIQEPVLPAISPALITKCAGSSVTISCPTPTSGTGPFTYQWFLNGVPYSTACPLTTSEPGNYYVVVYNKNNCDSTISNVVTIKDCKIGISINGACCSDGKTPITMTATGISDCETPIVSYQWSGPGGPFPAGATLTLNPPPTTTSTYSVTVTDANGCTASTSVIITACP